MDIVSMASNWWRGKKMKELLDNPDLHEELYRIQQRIDPEERRLVSLETKRKNHLATFNEAKSDREERRINSRLMMVQRQINNTDMLLQFYEKQYQFVSELVMVQRFKDLAQEQGLWNTLLNLPQKDVIKWIRDGKLPQIATYQKLDQFLGEISLEGEIVPAGGHNVAEEKQLEELRKLKQQQKTIDEMEDIVETVAEERKKISE